MITFDEFVKKYEGKTVGYPNDNSYLGECLSLTKWHIKEVYGIDPPPSGCNGARCYWSIFPNPLGTVLKKVPNTPNLIPKRGWIVVWNEKTGNGYGHIGSVLSANVNNFISLDQNWNVKSAERVTHNYNNVYGFLAPLNEPEGDNMSDYEEAIRKAVAYDEVCRILEQPTTTSMQVTNDKLSKLISDRERYQRERNEARSQRDGYAKKITELEGQLKDCLTQEIPGLPPSDDFEQMLQEIEKMGKTGAKKVVDEEGKMSLEISYKAKE